jgi:hypothetical protein
MLVTRNAVVHTYTVEQPTKFELVIYLQYCKTLRLDVPPTLLALANKVIE